MNMIDMFVDSTHLAECVESVNTCGAEVGQILIEVQATVNNFIATIGNVLRSDVVADTYMMYGEAFSDDNVKYFSVGVILMNKNNREQNSLIIPFRLVLTEEAGLPLGLTVVRQHMYV